MKSCVKTMLLLFAWHIILVDKVHSKCANRNREDNLCGLPHCQLSRVLICRAVPNTLKKNFFGGGCFAKANEHNRERASYLCWEITENVHDDLQIFFSLAFEQ